MIQDFSSVVLCTFNRAHLLARSLHCYAKQTDTAFELLVLDDGSEDGTEELVRSYAHKIKIRYTRLTDKKPGEWRDAGANINRGIILSEGEYVFITHPEVMVCFDCVEKAKRALKENPEAYFNARVYYLTSDMQERLDKVDWKADFYRVRDIEGFYEESADLYKEEYLGLVMNQFCTPRHTETCDIWESWVFGGMTRRTWKKFGGINESAHWGTVDFDFILRRRLMKWPTISPQDLYVIHQNHDKAFGKHRPTVRDFDSMLKDAEACYGKKRNFLRDMEL